MPGTAWPNPDLQSRPTARLTHSLVTLEADERPPCPWLWDQQGQGCSPRDAFVLHWYHQFERRPLKLGQGQVCELGTPDLCRRGGFASRASPFFPFIF